MNGVHNGVAFLVFCAAGNAIDGMPLPASRSALVGGQSGVELGQLIHRVSRIIADHDRMDDSAAFKPAYRRR
jgi:hypothetical protein